MSNGVVCWMPLCWLVLSEHRLFLIHRAHMHLPFLLFLIRWDFPKQGNYYSFMVCLMSSAYLLTNFGDRFLTRGGFWKHFWVVLEGLWPLFLLPGQLLGALFLVLEAPWGTLWYQMAPITDFFEFGMRFGIHFGRLLGSWAEFGRSFR